MGCNGYNRVMFYEWGLYMYFKIGCMDFLNLNLNFFSFPFLIGKVAQSFSKEF